MPLFESYERRIPQITTILDKYDIKSLEEAKVPLKKVEVFLNFKYVYKIK